MGFGALTQASVGALQFRRQMPGPPFHKGAAAVWQGDPSTGPPFSQAGGRLILGCRAGGDDLPTPPRGATLAMG